MRILFTFIIGSLLLIGCTSGSEINGRSLKTANRSVAMMKNRLPTEQKIEFEVSYWTLRDSLRNRDDFLDTVDGKSVEEMIVLGRGVFEKRKSEGFKSYAKYQSWEQMIAKFTQERLEQNRHKKSKTEKDRANSVIYNL